MHISSIMCSWLWGTCMAEISSLAFALTSAELWTEHLKARYVKSTFSLLIFINSTAKWN